MAWGLQLLLCGTTGVDTTKIEKLLDILSSLTNANRSRPIQIFYFLAVLQMQIDHDLNNVHSIQIFYFLAVFKKCR